MPYGNGFTYLIITQILFFIVTIALILWFIINSKQKEIYTTFDIDWKKLDSY